MDRSRHILISVSPGTEPDHKDSVQSVDLRLLKLSSLRDPRETVESSPPQKTVTEASNQGRHWLDRHPANCTQADHTGTGMVVCCLSGVQWRWMSWRTDTVEGASEKQLVEVATTAQHLHEWHC